MTESFLKSWKWVHPKDEKITGFSTDCYWTRFPKRWSRSKRKLWRAKKLPLKGIKVNFNILPVIVKLPEEGEF